MSHTYLPARKLAVGDVITHAGGYADGTRTVAVGRITATPDPTRPGVITVHITAVKGYRLPDVMPKTTATGRIEIQLRDSDQVRVDKPAPRTPVTLTHPARLTVAPREPGVFTLGRGDLNGVALICSATACTRCGPRLCEHSAAARVILSAQQAPEPMRRQPEQQQQDRDLPARAATLTRVQAAARLDVSEDWVRRLVKAGRLTLAGTDVTAASVDAYAATRHASRYAKTPDTETARAIAAAKRAQTRAAALERKARKLREAAKATLTGYGAGTHAGWLIAQGPSVDVAAHTRAGSWTAQPIAA